MILRAETALVRLQYLSILGIVATTVLEKTGIASALFYLTFVFTAALWLVTASRGISGVNCVALLVVLTAGISVAVNALTMQVGLSFGYFKKWIFFCSTVLCLAALWSYHPGKRDIRLIFQGNTGLTLFLIGMYVWQKPQMHLLNGQITAYLTFHFANPNQTGVFLAAVCMVELIQASAADKKGKRFFHILLGLVLYYFVCETRARNAQLMLLFFLGGFLLASWFPYSCLRMTKYIAGGIAVMPLLFSLAYLLMIRLEEIQETFSFLVGKGKGLDSRVSIWEQGMTLFRSAPVWGNYASLWDGTTAIQLHNTHLDILVSYGSIVLGLVCMFLFLLLYGERNGKMRFLSKMGFAALLLSGVGEAMLFSGGMGIYLYAGVFLVLSGFAWEEGKKQP